MSVGFLGTLLARFPSARAALIDNLDLKLSTNMPSKIYYTDARGGKIDYLDAYISACASAANLAIIDTVVDAIKAKTDTLENAASQTSQVFTSSGTWTKPSGVTKATIICVGGGGSGACGTYAYCGGGGGEIVIHDNVAISADLTVTVGSGGASVASASGINGNPGGVSSVTGGYVALYARGGGGGTDSTGGTGGGSEDNLVCKQGAAGGGSNAQGESLNGFALGGTAGALAGGGASYGGGGNGAADSSSDAIAGERGGGGGSAYQGNNSGAGGSGFVAIFWEA